MKKYLTNELLPIPAIIISIYLNVCKYLIIDTKK